MIIIKLREICGVLELLLLCQLVVNCKPEQRRWWAHKFAGCLSCCFCFIVHIYLAPLCTYLDIRNT